MTNYEYFVSRKPEELDTLVKDTLAILQEEYKEQE